jgi:hypothetical protein
MIPTLNWYFEVNGYYDEAISAFKSAVEHFRSCGAPASMMTTEERSAFAFTGRFLRLVRVPQRECGSRHPLLQESLDIAREQDDPEVMYYIHGNWGYLCLFTGEVEEARRLTAESLRYAQN